MVTGNHYVALSSAKKKKEKKRCQVAVKIGTRQSSEQQVVWSGKRANKGILHPQDQNKGHPLFLAGTSCRNFSPSSQTLISRFGIHYGRWLLNNSQALIIMRNIKKGKSLLCWKKRLMRRIKAVRWTSAGRRSWCCGIRGVFFFGSDEPLTSFFFLWWTTPILFWLHLFCLDFMIFVPLCFSSLCFSPSPQPPQQQCCFHNSRWPTQRGCTKNQQPVYLCVATAVPARQHKWIWPRLKWDVSGKTQSGCWH